VGERLPTQRIGSIEDCGVAGNLSPRSAVTRQHEEPGYDVDSPLEAILCDRPSESDLLVVLSQRGFDRAELGLHLTDEEVSGRLLERHHVHGAALTEVRVADLGRHLPAVARKPIANRPDKRSMPLIDQTVELAAAPAEQDEDVGIERRRHAADASDGHGFDVSALSAGHERLTDAGAPGNV
jgi:hypothetical protein